MTTSTTTMKSFIGWLSKMCNGTATFWNRIAGEKLKKEKEENMDEHRRSEVWKENSNSLKSIYSPKWINLKSFSLDYCLSWFLNMNLTFRSHGLVARCRERVCFLYIIPYFWLNHSQACYACGKSIKITKHIVKMKRFKRRDNDYSSGPHPTIMYTDNASMRRWQSILHRNNAEIT